MRTDRGQLGIVRDDVQAHDIVCILHGCSVPAILRPILKTRQEIRMERQVDREELKSPGRKRNLALTYLKKWRAWNAERKKKGEWTSHEEDHKIYKRRKRPIASTNPDDAKDLGWLRQHPGSYYCHFMGECYVHGIMDGESLVIQSQSAGESAPGSGRIVDQGFELR